MKNITKSTKISKKIVITRGFGGFLVILGCAGLILPVIPGIGFIFLGLGYCKK